MARFSLFGIPVGVHFSFLLIAFLVAGMNRSTSLGTVAATTAATLGIFLSVLLHESGHAFTARYYGADQVSITLFALGGVTTYSNDPPLSPGKRFVITAAGSGVAIVVGGALLLAARAGAFDGLSEFIRWSGVWFILASLGWGLLNWIPIRPLDGGQMLTAALEIVAPKRAEAIAKVVTGLTAGGLIIWLVIIDEVFLAAYVGFIAFLGLRSPDRSPGGSPHTEVAQESGRGPGVAGEIRPGYIDRRGAEDPTAAGPAEEEPPFPI